MTTKHSAKMPIPKYYLTKAILHGRLKREFSLGERLPSEYELSRSFGVSRVTIQQALALLEREGIIRREQGRGTFYLGEGTKRTELKLSGLLESAMRHPGGVAGRLLGKRVVQATDRVADRLQLPRGSPVVAAAGLGLVDQEPIIFVVAYLPQDIGLKLLDDDLDLENETLVSILHHKYKIEVVSAIQAIGATLADPTFSDHLGVEVGAPLLEVERTFFDAQGRPVNFSIAFYRADRYRFEVRMKDWGSDDDTRWRAPWP